MKNIFNKYIIILILSLGFSINVNAVEVACTPGQNINANVCQKCFEETIYYGDTPKSHVDMFYNTLNKEIIFSSSRSKIEDTFDNNFLIRQNINNNIISSYIPSSVDQVPIFKSYGIIATGKPSNRNQVVGSLLYNLHYTEVLTAGPDFVIPGDNWAYSIYDTEINPYTGEEYYEISDSTKITFGMGAKGYNSSNIEEHNECFDFKIASCGDGFVDIGYETCDDGNEDSGDGCSSTCSTEILPPVVPPVTPPGGGGGGGGGGGSNICGDGSIQRPNSLGQMEECDFGSESDWGFCRSDCSYGDLTIPGSGNREMTIPNGGKIVFGPTDNVIIGKGMNPYIAHSLTKPYINNLSDYDLYFDEICVVETSGTTLLGTSVCENMGGNILSPGEVYYLSDIPNFKGGQVTTGDYGNNRLVTTVRHNGIRYDNAYFTSILDVRVVKPSVATTGGGTSYLSSTNNISNISNVSSTLNKNFIGVGVSGGNTSYSNDVVDAGSVNTIKQEGENYNEVQNEVSNATGISSGNSSTLTDFENYNGNENTFILKNKNFIINSNIFSFLNGSRTYIIENGDLVINSNINYSDNIGFVVKGGNIQIDKSVTNIDGIFISILKDGVGGSFIGIGGETLNVLNVNGSLYGNINNLISKRTYIKENSSGQIDVGTIVSFGSSLFKRPAPLITTFINEYLNSEKVAK